MIVVCTNCTVSFDKVLSQIKRSNNHFCSRSCAASFNNKVKPKRLVEGTCKVCKTAIPSSLSYCSKKCRLINKEQSKQTPNKIKVSDWRRRLKIRALEYKGGKCEICGYNKCRAAMEFHHIDPSTKDFAIGGKGHCSSWHKVKTELDKCMLLCSNCHREVHAHMYK